MESNDRLEQLLRQMYAAPEDTDTSGIVDEEWAKFAAAHFRKGRMRRVAAAVIGVLMLSGIAYAAVQWLYAPSPSRGGNVEVPVAGDQPPLSADGNGGVLRFDDARLDSVLTVVAGHYHKQVAFSSDQLRALRFLIEWNPEEPLSTFISLINNFEGIHVGEAGDTIVVAGASEPKEQMLP